MANTWLPEWLGWLLAFAFVVVLAAHVVHAAASASWSRVWHGTHILMALGMIDMTWPAASMPVGAGAGKGVFAAAAAGAAVLAATPVARRGRPGWVWPVAAVDLGGMFVMFVMMSNRYAGLTLLLTAWFVLEAAGWALGLLRVAPARAEVSQVAAVRTAGGPTPAGGTTTGAADAATEDDAHALSVRITLAAMPPPWPTCCSPCSTASRRWPRRDRCPAAERTAAGISTRRSIGVPHGAAGARDGGYAWSNGDPPARSRPPSCACCGRPAAR